MNLDQFHNNRDTKFTFILSYKITLDFHKFQCCYCQNDQKGS